MSHLFGALSEVGASPLLMGVLNVTPDSFSDGGRFFERDAALAHAQAMVEEGATIIDVGGESSRPGASPVSVSEQSLRVTPIIESLRTALPASIAISIDTQSVEVAREALAAGASVVNDISAARESGMCELAAEYDAALVLMHMQGTPTTMQIAPQYQDVVEEVLEFLLARARVAEAAGVRRSRILLDPGIGFGKTRQHNLQLLNALPRFVASGYAILLGTSRKRFMGAICRETAFEQLVGATCATTALGVAAGVKIFRVHDVRANRQALEVAWAIGQANR